MTVLSMPSLQGMVVSSSFYLATNTQTFTSPVSNSVQTVELGGALWRGEITLRKMRQDEAARWIAFLLKLRGMSGTFYAGDPDWPVNLGVGGGTPLVNGGSQTGTSLVIDGAPVSTSKWLRAGDYFSVNSKLKRLTDDVNTDSGGNATLPFEPYIASAPADNAPVTIVSPKAIMKLADDNHLSWQSDKNGIYAEKTLSFFEALV